MNPFYAAAKLVKEDGSAAAFKDCSELEKKLATVIHNYVHENLKDKTGDIKGRMVASIEELENALFGGFEKQGGMYVKAFDNIAVSNRAKTLIDSFMVAYGCKFGEIKLAGQQVDGVMKIQIVVPLAAMDILTEKMQIEIGPKGVIQRG